MGKIGRNEPCPCGSGKKYKKCCLRKKAPSASWSDSQKETSTPTEAPTPAASASATGISPYTAAKLFENSEHFAQLKRRDPEKARRFWTPGKVAALSTEEILTRLHTLGVDASRDAYLTLAEGQTSAWAISGLWRRTITQPISRYEDDFLGLAACELWKRYCPDRPSIEMLDDWMQEGYRLESENEPEKACEIWWKVWQTIHARLRPEMTTIRDTANVFDGTQSLFNWVQDFELVLHNIASKENRFAKMGVQLCREVIAQFSGEDELFVTNFRAELGELYFFAGEEKEGERVLLQLIQDHPDRAAGYVGLAERLGYGFPPDNEPIDRERARKLLEQALARPVADADDYDLAMRLAELRQ